MTSTASLVWVQLYEAKPPPQEVCMWPSGLVKALGWIVYLLWLQAVYLHYKPKTWTLGLRQKFLQRFFVFFFSPNNTREFKAKRVAEQISHIPGSPAWAFSLRQQQCWVLGNWRALSIWTFLKGYTVSHLPSLQTNRKRDRETSRRACHEASQAGVFWRYLLISCTTALTFVSLPFPFASFLLPLMFPFRRPHPPFPFFPSPGFAFKWRCILSHPDGRHGNNVNFEPSFLSTSEALWPYVSNLFCSADTAERCDAAHTKKLQAFWNLGSPDLYVLNVNGHV